MRHKHIERLLTRLEAMFKTHERENLNEEIDALKLIKDLASSHSDLCDQVASLIAILSCQSARLDELEANRAKKTPAKRPR